MRISASLMNIITMEKFENRLIQIVWCLCAIMIGLGIISYIEKREKIREIKRNAIIINVKVSTVIARATLSKNNVDNKPKVDIKCPKSLYKHYLPLINAIVHVESRGDATLVGKDGDVGMMQQLEISVKEANRLNKFNDKNYTLKDRFDPKSQIEMFLIIQDYYNKSGDYEIAARLWNGHDLKKQKPTTLAYWKRVQSAMIKGYNYEHLWN